ncbi:hypothetical protein [Curtobacterium sp. VKM Ac-1393]|uniref:hypothetical protein n=1 Tax=Curtobacterium sp. VKM Ac-1393 TaxID=2783814 RepID=UPI00188BB375|nr:hypothetical protein [Curtobacterium sp. VKM Ac-1393]MBF4607404.1 hypothetical protein [Curtobacterium sp. VKM Ac-1393]
MRRRVSLLVVFVVTFAMLGGGTVIVLSGRQVGADPGADVAWVRLLTGVGMVTWGVLFARFDAQTRAVATERPDEESQTDAAEHDDTPRPMKVVLWVIVGAGTYSVLRGWTASVPFAAAGAVITLGLPLLNRLLDGVIERQEARGDGGPASGPAGD